MTVSNYKVWLGRVNALVQKERAYVSTENLNDQEKSDLIIDNLACEIITLRDKVSGLEAKE